MSIAWTLAAALAALVSAVSVSPAIEEITPVLTEAAADGDLDKVQSLISSGGQIDVRDSAGRTPLLRATRANHVDVARLLIEAGADVNAKDAIRDTPFLYAGAEGRDAILRMILATGRAQIDDTNRYGGTALIPAAHHGHASTVKILIDAGLAVDHVNDLGWTALMETVILGDGSATYVEIARLLLAAGALPIPDRDGRSPLDHARARGFVALTSLLGEAEGRDGSQPPSSAVAR